MNVPLLEIQDLHAGVENRPILQGFDLLIRPGEVHALMGPNGSGKSTLASILAGRKDYVITQGTVRFRGRNLLEMEAEERAREGLFLAFQYPVEIPGVNTAYFLRAALNEIRKHRQLPELDAMDFLALMKEKAATLGIPGDFLKRAVNDGFSGGEKKRNEIFQMALLEPSLAILDETDSGLDIDALKLIAEGVTRMRRPDNGQLIITHYPRLLEHLAPDVVHVLMEGRIVRSGSRELAHELELRGYDWVMAEAPGHETPQVLKQ